MGTFITLNINEIEIKRDARQRKDVGDVSDLMQSIRINGLINPIVVTKDNVLIAGERRLTAWKNLNVLGDVGEEIPVHYFEDLSEFQQQLVELDENIRRRDMPWQEVCNAVTKIHSMLTLEAEDNWTVGQTAERVGLSEQAVRGYLRIQRVVADGDTKIFGAKRLSQAINTIKRQENRKQEQEFSVLQDAVTSIITGKPVDLDLPVDELAPVLNESFLSWAPTYSGPKFNLIHCDFPYGIDFQKSEQGGSLVDQAYEDSEDIYWALLECLCQNWDNLASSSCHMMFWFSMKFYRETLEFFASRLPDLVVQQFPLIWFKSDNKGIVPDVTRQPRRVYETALLCSWGDRKIIKPIGNCYAAPTTKDIHQSEKSEPMLRYFMQMFVDEQTRMLDPTCGSGTALRAADSLGASAVMGLEINPDYSMGANNRFRKERQLRKALEVKS